MDEEGQKYKVKEEAAQKGQLPCFLVLLPSRKHISVSYSPWCYRS